MFGGVIVSDGVARLARLTAAGETAGAPGGWVAGEVTKAGSGELELTCDGLPLGVKGLYLAPGLDYHWTVDTGEDNLLRRGDHVVLLVTADRQTYYLICKAVKQ